MLLLYLLASAQADPDAIHLLAFFNETIAVNITTVFDGRGLSFSLSGLPRSSGLRITPQGVITGRPNVADANATQPLGLTVTAKSASGGSANVKVLLSIPGRRPAAKVLKAFFVPLGTSIPPIDVAKTLGITLKTLAISGLPKNSGFSVQKGVFGGAPNQTDLEAKQPLVILLNARDNNNQLAAIAVIITVERPTPPLAPPLFLQGPLTIVQAWNSPFTLDLRVLVPWLPAARFTLGGTPPGSGITLVNGVLQGTPNARDFNAPQPLILPVNIIDTPTATNFTLYIITTIVGSLPKSRNVIARVFVEGSPVFINASALPSNLTGRVTWTATGIPPRSGMVFNRTSGILSGTANRTDLNSKQPLLINIIGTSPANPGINVTLALIFTVIKSADGERVVTFLLGPSAPSAGPALPAGGGDQQQAQTQAQGHSVKYVFVRGVGLWRDVGTQVGSKWRFAITGLPRNSGLSLSPNGNLSGIPTTADSNAKQPINATLLLTDPNYPNAPPAQVPLYITVLGQLPSTDSLLGLFVHEGDSLGDIDFKSTARGTPPFTFQISALPNKSGFTFGNGVLSGVASRGDLLATQPLVVIVRATSNDKINTSYAIVITVLPARPPAQGQTGSGSSSGSGSGSGSSAPTGSGGPLQGPGRSVRILQVGTRPVSEQLAKQFTGGTGTLSFTLQGAPQGTGLSLRPDGTLSGLLTTADINQAQVQPLTLIVTCTDQTGQTAALYVYLSYLGATPSGASQLLSVFLHQGDSVNTDLSAAFALQKPFAVTSLGFPQGSGLSVDGSGILSGSPNSADVSSPQPLVVYLTATPSPPSTQRPVTIALVISILPVRPGAAAPASGSGSSSAAASSAGTTVPTGTGGPLQGPVRSVKVLLIGGASASEALAKQFTGGTGALRFTLQGAPQGTGLSLLPDATLTGALTAADIAQARVQPLTLIVTATDQTGQTASATVYVAYLDALPGGSEQLVSVFVRNGDSLSLDLSSVFTLPKPYTLTSQGFPQGSGLSLNENGVLGGTASSNDARSPQPIVVLLTATPNDSSVKPQTIAIVISILPARQ